MPAGITYTNLATYTLSSAQSSYTFTSVPTTYTDLILVGNMLGGTTNYDVRVGNGTIDGGSNYGSTRFFGDGTSATGDGQTTNTTGVFGNVSNGATVPHHFITHFNNYANTSTYKTALTSLNRADAYHISICGVWSSASAINTVGIFSTSSQNIPSGSTFTLYGIASA
jgi:hypothetical protein